MFKLKKILVTLLVISLVIVGLAGLGHLLV